MKEPIDEISQSSVSLSMVEAGLGSLLHAFQIPLAGHALSLNQGFMLTRTVLALRGQPGARSAPVVISSVAAILKSLSPAGKKLTPMLAISAQGLLFGMGTFLFGANGVGAWVGSTLLAIWGFLQPVLLYSILFGRAWLDSWIVVAKKLVTEVGWSNATLSYLLLGIIGIKILLSWILCLLALYAPAWRIAKIQDRLTELGTARLQDKKMKTVSSPVQGALRDLFNPLFLVSFALTLTFFALSEASIATLIWAGLRPVAVGFLLFWVIRVLPTDRLVDLLAKRGMIRFSHSLRLASKKIRGI